MRKLSFGILRGERLSLGQIFSLSVFHNDSEVPRPKRKQHLTSKLEKISSTCRGWFTMSENTMFIILHEVKNLIKAEAYSVKILWLTPRNDIVTQPGMERIHPLRVGKGGGDALVLHPPPYKIRGNL